MKQNTFDITFHGIPCKLEIGELKYRSYEQKQRHTYVFIDSDIEPEDIRTGKQPESYVNNLENNKLWRKYNRAEIVIQREILALAATLGGVDIKDLKFSRKAYCSCGCSPSWTRRDYKRVSRRISLSKT